MRKFDIIGTCIPCFATRYATRASLKSQSYFCIDLSFYFTYAPVMLVFYIEPWHSLFFILNPVFNFLGLE